MKIYLKYKGRYHMERIPESYPDVVIDKSYMILHFAPPKGSNEPEFDFDGLGDEVRFSFFGEYRKNCKVFECRI